MEDQFPTYPPGGTGRIPQRLIDKAEGDLIHAFVLWWSEAERRNIQYLIDELKRRTE